MHGCLSTTCQSKLRLNYPKLESSLVKFPKPFPPSHMRTDGIKGNQSGKRYKSHLVVNKEVQFCKHYDNIEILYMQKKSHSQ